MNKKSLDWLDKITNWLEITIAILLLLVIAVKVIEMVMVIVGFQVQFFTMEFARILSHALTLGIGVEFTKMLCKHTPETVIDVLLFAIARHVVMYHERTADMLIGIAAIAGLFAIKRYLICKAQDKSEE